MANIPVFLRAQVQGLIANYKDTVNGVAGGSPAVDLVCFSPSEFISGIGPNAFSRQSFYVLMDEVQAKNKAGQSIGIDASEYTRGQPVSKADLTIQIYNEIQDIKWLTSLPTH